MQTIHLLIEGKVQGVFYRATAKTKADELNISGWVRNTKDGYVEIVATGKEENMNLFIEWCKKGPESAQVSKVTNTSVNSIDFENFRIRR